MKPKYRFVRVRASRRSFIPSVLAAALALALGVKPSQAQSGTWTGAAGTGIWGGTGNWVSTAVASGSGNTASFVGEYTATQNVAVNTARTIGNITFTDTTSSHDVNIIPSSPANTLTLQVASGSPTINVTQADRTLTISNVVAGTQGLTKSGTGTLALSATNTLTGAVVVSAGTLRAQSVVGALGAGSLTLSGGTLQLSNDTGLNFARNTTVNGNTSITSDRLGAGAGVTHTLGTLSIGAQTLTVNRGANATSGTGGVTFGNATQTASSTFSPQANASVTLGGTTALGTFTLNMSGAGAMTMTGVVSGGPTAAASNALNVTAGTLTLSASGNTFTGDVVINGATAIVSMAGNTNGTFTTTHPLGRQSSVYKSVKISNGGTFRLSSGAYNVNTPTATNVGAGQVFNIGTGGGIFDVATGATFSIDDGSGAGTAWSNTQLQGSGTLTKVGPGLLILGNAATSNAAFTGQILINEGTLRLGAMTAAGVALGSTSAGTVIASGASLDIGAHVATAAEPLTISGTGVGGTSNVIFTSNTGTTPSFSGPITLAANSTIGSTTAGTITFNAGATFNLGSNVLTIRNTSTGRIFTDGIISGSGSVVLNCTSTGDYVPRSDHQYTGGTTLTAGYVAIDRSTTGDPGSLFSGPFGTGTVIFGGAQVRAGTTQNRTVGNDVTVSADTTFYTIGSEKSLNFSGPITLTGGNRTFTANVGTTVAGTSTTFSGAIGDGGNNLGLTKTGTGNLILSGANTYTGGTTANNGTLVLSGSVPTNTALAIVPNAASGVTLSLFGASANPLANVSALSLGSSAGPTTLGLELGANTAASDTIASPAAAVTSGTVNISIAALAGFGSASSYDLISAASGLSGATYALTNAPGGYVYSLNATDSLVQLSVTPASSGDIYWRGNTNGSWSAVSGSNTNWFADAAGSTNAQSNPGAGNTVRFSSINAASSGGVITTTLDNNFTVKNLIFGSDPNGVTSVTIAGGSTPALAQGILSIAPTSSSDGIAVGSNAGSVTISAPVILGANQTWGVDGTGVNGSALTVSGAITGTSTLGISGLVTISSASATSTYSGATNVLNGGVLQGGATNSFSANSAVTVNSSATVRLNGFSNSIGSLAGSGVVENNTATAATLTAGADGTDTTFSGILRNGSTATLGLTKTGAGRLTLSGSNTHTGATTVNAGTLAMGSATALTSTNPVTLTSTGTLDLNGFSVSTGAITSTDILSAITNNSTSTEPSTATSLGTPSGDGVYVDALTNASTGAVSALITDGATRKTQIVFANENSNPRLANASNSFTGGVILKNTVSGTRLSITAAIVGTPYGTGPIVIGESPTDRAGIYFSTVGNNTLPNPLIVNTALGTDRVGLRTDVANITLSGVITANLAPVTFTANTATAGSFYLTNQVTGASGLVVDITSLGANPTQFLVALNNATENANNYQGDTVVNFNATAGKSATLQLLQSEQIPNGAGKGNVIVNSNDTGIGLLSLAGGNETINGLSGSGNVASTFGDVTLTLGDNNATASHSGQINNTSGTLSVTKIGTGTQTLSGASNFAGALTVNGGLVAFPSSPATSGPLGNSLVVNLDGGGISYTSSTASDLSRPLAIAAGAGTVDVASSTGALTVPSISSTGGNLIKSGSGTAILLGSTSLNGGAASVQINQGTLRAGFGTNGVATINVAAAGHLDQTNTATEALVLANNAGALTLAGGSQLTFELSGASCDSIDTGTSGTAVTSGTVTLNLSGTPAAGTYNLLTSTAGGLAGANYVIGAAPNGFNYTINKSDNLVSLTVSTQTPIYWAGGQDLSWSTLGSSGTANWTTDAAGTLNALSTPVGLDSVIFSTAAAPNTGGVIATTLDGAFTVDSLQFTNNNTAVTAVSINAGTGGALTLTPASPSSGIRVLANGGAITIAAPLTVGAAQTWDIDSTGSLVVSGDTTFTGAVNKTNGGSLTLSGNNTGSGAITLSAGTLNLGSNTALGSGIFTIGAGTTINASSAAVALSTNNAQNWNGNFTFTGSNDLNLGAGNVTLGDNVLLTSSGSVLTVGGNIGDGGNNRAITKTGAGTMVLAGTNTYGGLTTLTGGVLRITNGSALGSTAAGITQSGTSALELDGSAGALTISAEALTIAGGGITDQGALRNLAGDNTYGGTVTMAIQSRINSDSGTLTLSNPTSVTSEGRTLVVGGAGNMTINGVIALGTGGVAKDGAGTLTLAGNNTYTGNTSLNVGVMNITGSLTGNGTPATGPNLLYGVNAGNSVVNINGNITNYLRFQGATNAGSNAAYIQTGGTVNFTSTQVGNPTNVVASAGYGYMQITGGSTKAGGRFAPSNGSTTTGVMYVGGSGVLDNTTGEWFLMTYSPAAGNGGGRAMLTVDSGGTFNRVGATNLFGLNMDRSGGYAVLNVAGGSVLNSTQAITFGNGTSTNITGTSGFLNLAAGTLQIGANFRSGNSGTGSTGNNAYLNFAGGTLRAQNTLSDVIPASAAYQTVRSTVYGPIDNVGTANDYAGGLVVDSNSFNVTFTNPLVGAETSYGVTQANIPDLTLLPNNSGYIGAPMVQFAAPTAGGVPASGYAVMSGGQVTGIVITNPGTYQLDETPEITLTGGGGSITPASTTPLQTLNTAGGLTKNGTGILTMSGANTYAGPTVINGGTLLLNGTAASLPTTSAVTVNNGGTLAFTSGSASTLDLGGKALTLNGGSLAFDVGVSGINDAISVDTFTLSANSAFAFTGIGAVGGTYTLLTSANPIINTGGFTISGQSLGRVNLTPTINSNSITVTTTLDEGVWNQTGGGNWSLGNSGGPSAPNWDNYKPTVSGDGALFGSAITAPSTVVVDTPHTVGYLRFDSANAYTIGTNGSSNLTMNNGTSTAAITVNSGSHTIAENVALLSNLSALPAANTTLTISGVVSGTGRTVEVNGLGTVELSAANTYTGTTTVSNGTLTLSGARTGASGAFNVGNLPGLNAALNISAGSYALGANAMNVGNIPTTAATATVNQTGGAISFTSGNALLVGQNTVGNTGIYNLSGGSITTFASAARGIMLGVNPNPAPGLDSGGGIFNLSGTGVLNMTATSGGGGDAALQIGRSDTGASNTTNAFNQTGGTANVGILAMGGAASGSSNVNATLNLTGGVFSANQFTVLAAGAANTATISLGGSALVTLPAFPTTRGAGSTATLTLDSTTGSLTPLATSGTYMPAGTFTNAYLTANGAKFNVPSGRDITIAQVLENATEQVGTLAKDGVGTLTLSAANTYTGLTSVLAGGITVGNVNALGTLDAGTTVASGGRLAFNALTTGAIVAENFNVAGNGTAGNGVLNVGGSKTINLSGDIVLSADSRFTVDGGSAFNFTGINGISGNNTNLIFHTDGAVASSITGPLALGTGSLTKASGSTLVLAGDNTHSGGTDVQGGILQVNHNNGLGTGAATINGGIRISIGSGVTVSNPITINTNAGAVGRGLLEASAGTATVTGPITVNNAAAAGGHFCGVGTAILDLQSVITSNIADGSIVHRNGLVRFSGGGTGYTRFVNGEGTTIVGANNGIATTADFFLANSAAGNLDLNGFNQTLVGITKGNAAAVGRIGNSSTTDDSNLTVTGTSSFSGVIQDTLGTGSRKVSLTVASGSLTLTNANLHTGGTTVNQGVLTIDTGGVISGATGPLSVNNTNTGAGNATVVNLAVATDTTVGSLSGAIATPSSDTNTATINTQTGRSFTVNQTSNATFAGTIAGAGSFALGSSSTASLTLSGVNTYTGNTSVNAGTLLITGSVAGTASVA
ncbi:MAG: autotransporter-associated beta strand repeat-containing protein, partial [Pirellula sp.]